MLLYWNCFDRVIVSTKDTEVSEFARLLGVEVPSLRWAELSDENTGIIQMIDHTVK